MLRSAVPLALLLVLQLSGSDGGFIYQTVIEGDDVTLSCENVLPDQNQCELTDWIIGNNPNHRLLFNKGKKDDAVSSSVSLLQNCSLVLHRVTKEQAGKYTCQQSKEENKETQFQLFVASLSQEKKDDRVTLTCSVATPGGCIHDVEFVNDKEDKELEISRSLFDCGASMSFKDPSPPSPFYETLRCQVKQTDTNQIFILFPRPSQGQKTDQLLTVAVPVVIAATLILAFVALMLWRRSRGSGDANGQTVNPEDGVTYASVQINQKKTKNPKSPQSRDGEEDVTYSSVNVH